MTAPNSNGTRTSRDAARHYLRFGIHTVPVKPHDKLPWDFERNRLRDEWEQLRVNDADIDRLFAEGCNIGVILGAPSGGLVDVDLDCPEARRAAPHLLPDTDMVGGRESAPDSHYFFVADDPPPKASDKFLDPCVSDRKRNTVLELRSTGGQTVVAPSVYGIDLDKGHHKPERFVWRRHGAAAKVSIDVLATAVRGVAAAALLARYWPTSSRHDAALALGGGLRRAGWLEEAAVKFVTAICAAAEDREVNNRAGCVRDTFARRADERATGWPTLTKLLGARGDAIVGRVTDWLRIIPNDFRATRDGNVRDFRDGFSGSALKWNLPAPLPEMPDVPPFPIDLFPARVADYWSAAAESLGYPVDFVAVPALPLLGAAAGRSIAAEVKRTYKEPPLLWCGLVAPPGAAKSPSLAFAQGPLPRLAEHWVREYQQRVKEYRTEALRYDQDVKEWKKGGCEGQAPEEPERPTVRQLVYSNFTVETLIRGNHANPRGIAVCKDELSGLVCALNQYKGGRGDDRQNLLSMWAGAGVTYNREKDRTAGAPPLTMSHTFLAVGGMIQPDLLAAFRGDVGRGDGGNDGWADRFLLSFPDPPEVTGENWRTVSEPLEAGYADVFRALLDREMVPVTDDEGNVVTHRPFYAPFDGAAERAWEEFTWDVADRMNRLGKFDSYRGVLSKSRHHLVRLAALLHALRCACGEVAADAPVAGETVCRAVSLIGYFEAHGRRCLGVGWLDQPCRVARRLLDWLGRHSEMDAFTRSDAYIQLKDGKDVRKADQLDAPLRLLVDLNYIRPLVPAAVRCGPVATAYQVNPAWDRTVRYPVPKVPNVEHPSDGPASNIRDFRDGISGNPSGARADRPSESSPTSVQPPTPPAATPSAAPADIPATERTGDGQRDTPAQNAQNSAPPFPGGDSVHSVRGYAAERAAASSPSAPPASLFATESPVDAAPDTGAGEEYPFEELL